MRSLVLAAALGLAAAPALAEVTPQPGGGDPRIQSVTYAAEEVVRLRIAFDFQLTLEMAPDEHVETVSVGNGGVWQITPNKRGDLLFLKPLPGAALTNMTLVTDQRRYAFLLEPVGGLLPDLPFTVRLRAPPAATKGASPPASNYRLSGDEAVRPRSIQDDGRFTYLTWGPDQALPATFAVGADGVERAINGVMRDEAFVVEGVAPRLVFRRGSLAASAQRRAPEPRP